MFELTEIFKLLCSSLKVKPGEEIGVGCLLGRGVHLHLLKLGLVLNHHILSKRLNIFTRLCDLELALAQLTAAYFPFFNILKGFRLLREVESKLLCLGVVDSVGDVC